MKATGFGAGPAWPSLPAQSEWFVVQLDLIVIPSYICNNEYISSVSQGISASLTSYFRLGFVAAKINGFFSIYFSDVGIICKLHFTVKEGVLLFSWYFSVLTQFIYFSLQRETM